MLAAIDAEHLARSLSDSSRGIAGRGPVRQAMPRSRNDINCRHCGLVGHFKIKCSLRSRRLIDSSRSSMDYNLTTHADSTNETVDADEVPYAAEKHPPITTPTAAPGGANRLTATLALLQPGRGRYRYFAALTTFQNRATSRNTLTSPSVTKEHPTAAIAAGQSHNEETWPFRSLSASCPCPFEECAKPAISFGVQEKPQILLHERGHGG